MQSYPQLTDEAIKAAEPRAKAHKLWDEKGLYLLVTPAGAKLWRFKYRFGGRENSLSLGVYPATGLTEARKQRDAARRLKEAGIDPGMARKLAKAGRHLKPLKEPARDEETVIDELARKIAARVADILTERLMERRCL